MNSGGPVMRFKADTTLNISRGWSRCTGRAVYGPRTERLHTKLAAGDANVITVFFVG
jgi:hypothetical protein